MIRTILPWEHRDCGQNLSNLQVTKLERVENMMLWENYQQARNELYHKMRECGRPPPPINRNLRLIPDPDATRARIKELSLKDLQSILLDADAIELERLALAEGKDVVTAFREELIRLVTDDPQVSSAVARDWLETLYEVPLEVLTEDINEFRLWHGTDAATAKIIASQGFDERVAREGLYGAGSYFTDAICKADQYSKRGPNREGERCIMYCRVIMGFSWNTPRRYHGRRPPLLLECGEDPPPHDSIYAQGGVANHGNQHHNEYVVFNGHQVYPEYIIWYKIP